jgi:hypothetical protein
MPRTLLIVALLSLVAITSDAQSDDAGDLVGVYVSTGVNPDGSPYKGLVKIEKQRDTFEVQWFGPELAAVGLGIRSGDVLAVTYFSGVPGVVAYKIEKGPRLIGEWTIIGAGGRVFSETLTKTADDALPSTESGVRPERPRSTQPGQRRRRATPPKGSREI